MSENCNTDGDGLASNKELKRHGTTTHTEVFLMTLLLKRIKYVRSALKCLLHSS
jgi:hypothetical protein